MGRLTNHEGDGKTECPVLNFEVSCDTDDYPK